MNRMSMTMMLIVALQITGCGGGVSTLAAATDAAGNTPAAGSTPAADSTPAAVTPPVANNAAVTGVSTPGAVAVVQAN